MATVAIIYRKEKANKKGEIPLYLRIIKNRKPKYISLGVRLEEKHWDDGKKRVRKSHRNSQRLNNFIAQKVAEAEGLALEMESKDKNVAPKKIKLAVMGQVSPSFLNFFREYIRVLEKKKKAGTLDKAKVVYSKLVAYLDGKDFRFDELTVAFLKRYEAYLRDELGNKTNTIHSNLKVLRKLYNDAVNEELVTFESNPFLRFKLAWQKTEKAYLSEVELRELEALALRPGTNKYHFRNMYVFAAYTGGIRISDMLQLKWENYDGERIQIKMQKTGELITIKVPSKAKEILSIYHPSSSPTAFIFPIFKNDRDYSDPIQLAKAISSSTAQCNRLLREIAEKLGLNHNLSFHTSRHTWATRALRKGMRIEYVSKLMGHSSVQTTEIYAKIVNEELEKAMDVFE